MSIKLTTNKKSHVTLPSGLLDDLKQMIAKTRSFIATTINSNISFLCWQIKSHIQKRHP